MANLHELGVAMLLADDTLKAEQYLSAALRAEGPDDGRMRKASVRFARGIVNQELRDYDAAVQDFGLQCLPKDPSEDPLEPALAKPLPRLTRAECLNSMGYATFLKALYEVVHADDLRFEPPVLVRTKTSAERVAEAEGLLQEALRHFEGAVGETVGEPQGMFFFNRGKAKYFLALLSSTHSGEADFERSSALLLTPAEQASVLEALADFDFCVTTQNFGTTAEGYAMRAQALAVLGDMPAAERAAAQAEQHDPRVFLVDLSSTEQLCTPWPLPLPPRDDAAHDFVDGDFLRPHYCDHCLRLITNFRNANRCARCQFRVHRGCLEKAGKLRTCWKEKKPVGYSLAEHFTQGKEVEAPASHMHVMDFTYFHKPTWCNACSGFCVRPYGYKCEECRFRIHPDCLDGLDNCVVRGAERTLEAVAGGHINATAALDAGLRELPVPTAPGEEIEIRARTMDKVATLKTGLLKAMGSPLPASRLSLLLGDVPLKRAADLLSVAAVGLGHGSTVTAVTVAEDQAVDAERVSAYQLLKLQTTGLFEDQ